MTRAELLLARGAIATACLLPCAAVAAGPPDPEDAPPPQTSYHIELEIQEREARIDADRRRAIGLLEEFVTQHADNRAMPEALYRLAALYWERSQERFLSAMGRWADTVERCKADPESCPQGPPPEPTLDLTDSQALYERLIGQYPGFRKLDTVRYLYGFSLRDQGRVQEAQAQFWAIIRKHPRSSFVPDAWLAIGDHRFYSDNDFDSALEAYERVLGYPDSDGYAMALFKSAWCHWKLGQSEAAVRRFKEVLDQGGDPEADEAGRQRLADLREEALAYLVQVLSEDETNTPKDIYDFLASIDGTKYSRKVLVRLAEAYEAQSRYDRSVATYRFLVDLDPQHEDAGRFQLQIATGHRGAGEPAKALDELDRLHARYGPRTDWGKAHPQAAKDVDAEAQTLLLAFSKSIHESAQAHEEATKAADVERYGLAARAYGDYIERYPSTQSAVEISYLVGDIRYFKLAQPEAAGDAYLRVGESAPVGPLHRDALLAAINAYEEALASAPAPAPSAPPEEETSEASSADAEAAQLGEQAEPDSSEASKPKPEPSRTVLEGKFIRAVDRFSALFPEDEENGAVLYKLGSFLYDRGDYDGAVARFGKVAVEYPNSANAGAAGDRILEALNKAEDYGNIELWAGKLKGAPAFAEAAEQQRLDRIIVSSLLAQAETLAKRGYYDRAAGYYLRMAREYPRHELAPRAMSNAGASLERARKAALATDVYERLAKDYPGTREAAEATLVVARVYENMADYERAAEHYDELAERYPKHSGHADALFNAGVLYQALGKPKAAAERFGRYAKRYRGREDALDVELRAARVRASAGEHRQAVKALKAFVRAHGRSERTAEAYKLLGQSLLAQGQDRDADRAFAASVDAARGGSPEQRLHGAQARYLQGEIIYRSFEASKLDQRPARLGASLERKAKLLAEAKNVYVDVLTLQTAEWSTAALFRIGESYETFARSLREYPMPKGLSEDEEMAYMEQLDTYALAFEEEAIGAYRSGYDKARELGIYNAYTKKIREALGRLSPREYPPIVEAGAELRMAEGSGGAGRPIRRLKR